MMISGNELGSVVATYLQKNPTSSVAGSGATGAAGVAPAGGSNQSTDGVTISAQPGFIGRMVSALHNLPDVRAERVLQARSGLESGQQPSSQQVARQIVSRVVGDHLAGGG